MNEEDADLARAIAASIAADDRTIMQDGTTHVVERNSGVEMETDEDEEEEYQEDAEEYESDEDLALEEAMQMDMQTSEPAASGIPVHDEQAQQLMALAGMEDIEQAKKCLAVFNYDLNAAAASLLDGSSSAANAPDLNGP